MSWVGIRLSSDFKKANGMLRRWGNVGLLKLPSHVIIYLCAYMMAVIDGD
jgi:hypothetical protein